MRIMLIALAAMAVCLATHAGEEKIRGMLEKTAKADACAQIADALNELYYVAKTDAAEKMVTGFVGKNQKVELTGTIENKPNETIPFINVTAAAPYLPKMPAAPPPPAPLPPPPEPAKPEVKKEEPKKPEVKPEVKKDEPPK